MGVIFGLQHWDIYRSYQPFGAGDVFVIIGPNRNHGLFFLVMVLCSLPLETYLAYFDGTQQVGAEPGVTGAADAPPAVAVETEAPEMNDAWTCPICLSWFDMPVAPPCRHSFCSGVRNRGQLRRRQEHQRVLVLYFLSCLCSCAVLWYYGQR